MPVPMKDPGAMTGLATLTGRGTLKGEGRTHRPTRVGLQTKCHPMMLLLQVAVHRARRRLQVLHQITSPMHQTHRQAMLQEVDQTIQMHHHPLDTEVPQPLATQLATKVTRVILVATCTMDQAQPTIATTLDTRVERQEATRRRLSQVATSLLPTKAVVLAMVVVHQTTRANQVVTQATKVAVTTTTPPLLPTRAGTGQGGTTSREHW